MKIKVDEVEIFDLPAWQIELLEYIHPSQDLVDFLKSRLIYQWSHKVNQAYIQLQTDWMPKLIADGAVATIPSTSKEAFFAFVKAHTDYKDRDAKDLENQQP